MLAGYAEEGPSRLPFRYKGKEKKPNARVRAPPIPAARRAVPVKSAAQSSARRPALIYLTLVMPVVVMFVLPLVTELDVREVGVGVADDDCSLLSRRIVADVDASEYLSVRATTRGHGEVCDWWRTVWRMWRWDVGRG